MSGRDIQVHTHRWKRIDEGVRVSLPSEHNIGRYRSRHDRWYELHQLKHVRQAFAKKHATYLVHNHPPATVVVMVPPLLHHRQITSDTESPSNQHTFFSIQENRLLTSVLANIFFIKRIKHKNDTNTVIVSLFPRRNTILNIADKFLG